MENKVLAHSSQMKDGLDDNYTLYENGEILHEYDKHQYPGGYNLKRTLISNELKPEVKQRLLKAASENEKALVSQILGL